MSLNSGHKLKNIKINQVETKNKILKYLYSHDLDYRIKYTSIINNQDLDFIKYNDYIICPRFGGTRSWILFFYDEASEVYYAINFPKRNPKRKCDITIYPIDIKVEKKFYCGTIMEGIYYRFEDKRYLIVDEVYVLAGENQLLKSKEDRLNYLSDYFKNNISFESKYAMYVSQYYHINQSSLKDLFYKIKEDSRIQEIIFYPNIYGRKIYNYTIIDSDLEDNVIEIAIFTMQKTACSDVYYLFIKNTSNKIGIAHIPDIKTSKKCKSWFSNKKIKEVTVKCQLNEITKKWVPLELLSIDN